MDAPNLNLHSLSKDNDEKNTDTLQKKFEDLKASCHELEEALKPLQEWMRNKSVRNKTNYKKLTQAFHKVKITAEDYRKEKIRMCAKNKDTLAHVIENQSIDNIESDTIFLTCLLCINNAKDSYDLREKIEENLEYPYCNLAYA